jgi:hypothetical protein
MSNGALLKNLSFAMLNAYMKNIKADIINPETEKNKTAVLVPFIFNMFFILK